MTQLIQSTPCTVSLSVKDAALIIGALSIALPSSPDAVTIQGMLTDAIAGSFSKSPRSIVAALDIPVAQAEAEKAPDGVGSPLTHTTPPHTIAQPEIPEEQRDEIALWSYDAVYRVPCGNLGGFQGKKLCRRSKLHDEVEEELTNNRRRKYDGGLTLVNIERVK